MKIFTLLLFLSSSAWATTDHTGFAVVSVGYPSTIYSGTFKSEIDQSKAAGSASSVFRLHFGAGAYFPTVNSHAYFGPIFNFNGDKVLEDIIVYRVGAAASLLFYFNSISTDSIFLRGDVGPEFLTKTGLLQTREDDFGAQILVGGGYSLAGGQMITADYSLHLGTNMDRTITVGVTFRVMAFEAKHLLPFIAAD